MVSIFGPLGCSMASFHTERVEMVSLVESILGGFRRHSEIVGLLFQPILIVLSFDSFVRFLHQILDFV